MPDYEYFYILTESDLKEVRNLFAQRMEDHRDAFEVSLGDSGVEWEVSDMEMAEEHLKAKAAYDALTVLMTRSYKTYKPESFAQEEGDRQGKKKYGLYTLSDSNMWSSIELDKTTE